MGKINPKLREEIQLKFEKIARDSEYYDSRKRMVIQSLRSIGDVYSFWIENPELRKALLLENRQEKTIKKKARLGIRAVKDGWYFLSKTGALGDFVNKMDENVLKRLNGLIEPKIEGTGSFRETDVTLNTPGYTPPSWEKVPERVKNLILKVREMYKKDPLEAAILAHLEIAAVQPFVEGNKRCARLIQDRILFDAEIPPAIIQAGEGKYYLGLLQRTLPAYRTDKIDGQREFYDYCASKVNNGLDEILADISDESIMNN